MIVKMFFGLSECDVWEFFDKFNNLEIEVLSIIALQIKSNQTYVFSLL